MAESDAVKEILKEIKHRLSSLEGKVNELERQQRILFMESEARDPENALDDQAPKTDLLDFLEEMNISEASPDDMAEDEGLLEHISKRLDESHRNQTNIYHVLIRLFLKQEVQNSRSKLLFISQNNKDLDLMLFDELSEMEEFVSNPMINIEELSLRWKIFGEKVAKELERLDRLQRSRASVEP